METLTQVELQRGEGTELRVAADDFKSIES